MEDLKLGIVLGDSLQEFIENLTDTLRTNFGLVVTSDPAMEGVSTHGIIISNRPLTEEELELRKENEL